MNDCKSCKHYGLYEMITSGPYGYSEKIPCHGCSRFSITEDNYESVSFQQTDSAGAEIEAGVNFIMDTRLGGE